MKIDKKMIDMVLKLNDDQLWSTIKLIGTRSGIDALKGMDRPKDMSKIRNALSQLTDEDIARVTEIFGKGKKKWGEKWATTILKQHSLPYLQMRT